MSLRVSQSLSGLNAVAVVQANATLGDPYHDPAPPSRF